MNANNQIRGDITRLLINKPKRQQVNQNSPLPDGNRNSGSPQSEFAASKPCHFGGAPDCRIATKLSCNSALVTGKHVKNRWADAPDCWIAGKQPPPCNPARFCNPVQSSAARRKLK